ncbi:MAG: hypothetical protein H6719_17135 [Sandaracinaceae bacterium]|nr:hypothetical protein [Sandaracinaceae bacterium]
MSVPTKFVLEQGPTLKGMGGAALGVLKQRLGLSEKVSGDVALPGPEIRRSYPPRDPALVRAYVKHVGGDPSAYKGRVPASLFPQWAFGLTGPCLEGTRYPLLGAMNGGCRLVQNAPIPIGEALEVVGRLAKIDDDGRRAILEIEVVTSTISAPEALVATMIIFVPLPKKKGENGASKDGAPKEKARVPADARELAFHKLRADAGLDFAKLTGDFNPVHWVPAYAKAFGFRNTILHGFGTMARAVEGLNRGLLAGDVDALEQLEVRFTRPLVLPAKVGVYVAGDQVYVGTAPSGPAFLTGTFKARNA